MAAIAPMTIVDGAATPVNHTFNPIGKDANGIAKWQDQTGGIAVGFSSITFSLKEPAKGAQNYRVVAKVVLPVLEQTSPSTSTGIQPAPTKAYDLIANVEFVLPQRSTLQNRKDILAMVKDLLTETPIADAVQNFTGVW
jgi:hypothetical protein